MKKLSYLIGLLLILNGCSLFKTVDPLQVQYDLKKEDRPEVPQVICDCEDPEPMTLGIPYPYKKEKGEVRLTNDDYDTMADNQQARLRFQKHGRSYKGCMARCLDSYNKKLNKYNN